MGVKGLQYPIVYDRFETDFSRLGLAVLDNVYELRVFERINGEYVCTFSIPLLDEKFGEIREENIIKVYGRLFTIRTVTEQRTENDELLAHVEAEHVSTELLGEYIDRIALTAVTAQTALDAVLAGSRFSGSALSMPGTYDFSVEGKNAVWGLNHLLALTDGELRRNNFTIELRTQIGSNNGVMFRYRKNIRSIRRTVDTKGVITRLYVYGKDGIKVGPIDSPHIGQYPRPKVDTIAFPDVEDTTLLTDKGTAFLSTVDTPLVSYDVQIVELKAAVGYDESEGFVLGDTVRVYDEDLGITVSARIVEYEEYPLEPERSRCTLANFLPDLADDLAKLNDTRQVVQNVTRNGRLNTYWLDGVINALQNQIKASGNYANAQQLENQGFLLENNDQSSPDYGALYLGPGWLMIADSKLGDGSWNWRTFGTGKGFTADLINAGKVRAELVQVGPETEFELGYDPSTKETPTGAQAKADAAQAAAEAAAQTVAGAESALAEARAKAYADGIVTAEEQARIDQAAANLATAQADATSKANAAKQAAIDAAAADATAKANAAQAAAEAVAEAEAQLAKTQAQAYADGKVTAEEQARINQDTATLNAAKADATAKANAAEQAAKDAAVLKGSTYNGVTITPAEGIKVQRGDGKVRTWQNATEGFKIQRLIDWNWYDKFYADVDGKLFADELEVTNAKVTGQINATSGNFTGTITGGIFEGGVFRTAASGSRIEINLNASGPLGSGGGITSYDNNGTRRGFVAQPNGGPFPQGYFGYYKDGGTIFSVAERGIGDEVSVTFAGSIGSTGSNIYPKGSWFFTKDVDLRVDTSSGGTLPSTALGYIQFSINGTIRKVPYFA